MQVYYQSLDTELINVCSFTINENLNVDKANGWDKISIRMIHLCGKEIVLSLKLPFKSML